MTREGDAVKGNGEAGGAPERAGDTARARGHDSRGSGSLVIPSRQPRLSMSVKALWLGASVAPPGQKALTSINIY